MTDKKNGLTYSDAGVDIDAGNNMVEKIKPLVKSTRRAGAAHSSCHQNLPDAAGQEIVPRHHEVFPRQRPPGKYTDNPTEATAASGACVCSRQKACQRQPRVAWNDKCEATGDRCLRSCAAGTRSFSLLTQVPHRQHGEAWVRRQATCDRVDL